MDVLRLLGKAGKAFGKSGKAADSVADAGKAGAKGLGAVDDVADAGKAGAKGLDAADAIGDGRKAVDKGSKFGVFGTGVVAVFTHKFMKDNNMTSPADYFFDGVSDLGDGAGGAITNLLITTILPIFMIIVIFFKLTRKKG